MKLTNNFGAPPALYNAIKNDEYQSIGDISVTTLIDAPKLRFLKRKHKDEFEMDVRDLFMALFGTIAHEILEKGNRNMNYYFMLKKAAGIVIKYAKDEKDKAAAQWLKDFAEREFGDKVDKELHLERRLSITFECEHGTYEISGAQDIYHEGTGVLEDWKTTTVKQAYYYKYEKTSWTGQQNIYAYILRKNGYKTTALKIQALYKDWSKVKIEMTRKGKYPNQPWDTFELPMWTDEECEAYITERIRIHKLADKGIVPNCTPDDRWSKPDQFAVKAKGRNNAVRVFMTQDEAVAFIDINGMKYNKPFVEYRPQYDLRCNQYCPVAQFCEQKKEREEMMKQYQEEADETFKSGKTMNSKNKKAVAKGRKKPGKRNLNTSGFLNDDLLD